mgnify:CR=1 FL=1
MSTEKSIPISFSALCVIEADYIYVSSKPDQFEEDEAYSRLFFLDLQNKKSPWVHHDLIGHDVVSLCLSTAMDSGKRIYCALSRQGDIEYSWPGGSKMENIKGAGLLGNELPLYGYVNCIKEISSCLYVCGGGGQIYKRNKGKWSHLAPHLKTAVKVPTPNLATNETNDFFRHEFQAIGGFNDEDIYVVGTDGEVLQYNGTEWRACNIQSTETLTDLCCSSDGIVWICGYNGSLLKGSYDLGFEELSTIDDNMTFTSIVLYKDRPYLASTEGLFYFDNGKIQPVRMSPKKAIDDTHSVGVSGGILWSVGYKEVLSFDGLKWTKFPHPDNEA